MARYSILTALLFASLALGFQSKEAPEAVKPPQVSSKPEPKYSEEARTALVEGIVVLQIVVDEQGRATNIEVLSPLGYGLDESAIATVAQWRFQPGTKNGKPVKVLAQVEVTFRLGTNVYNEKLEKQRTTFNLALHAVQQRKVTPGTIKSLSDLTSQKYAPGIYLYGKVMEEGLGVAADAEQGFRLIEESADRKYGPAMYEVALARLKGDRLDKDPAKGIDMMQSAAKFGSRAAQIYLGNAYETGGGVSVDSGKARQYYRLCAAAGEAACQFHLGKSLLDSGNPDRDYVQAIAWLMLASDQKIEDAEKVLEQEDARLTPAQVASANRLKAQLVHHR